MHVFDVCTLYGILLCNWPLALEEEMSGIVITLHILKRPTSL